MYEEFLAGARGVRCTWERSASEGATSLIIPDGCVDLVWFSDGRIEVAGPDSRPRLYASGALAEIVGLRFSPGAARGFLGIPIRTITDEQPHLGDVASSWRKVVDRLVDHTPAPMNQRRRLLEQAVAVAGGSIEGAIQNAIARVYGDPRIRVEEMAAELSVSSRQLHRRFLDEVGYGPKLFARVVRLHRLLARAAQEHDLSAASFAAGYASQSHMTDEVRALTSLTPVRFVEAWGAAPT